MSSRFVSPVESIFFLMSLAAVSLHSSLQRIITSRRFLKTFFRSSSLNDEICCLNSGIVSRPLIPICALKGDFLWIL